MHHYMNHWQFTEWSDGYFGAAGGSSDSVVVEDDHVRSCSTFGFILSEYAAALTDGGRASLAATLEDFRKRKEDPAPLFRNMAQMLFWTSRAHFRAWQNVVPKNSSTGRKQ